MVTLGVERLVWFSVFAMDGCYGFVAFRLLCAVVLWVSRFPALWITCLCFLLMDVAVSFGLLCGGCLRCLFLFSFVLKCLVLF